MGGPHGAESGQVHGLVAGVNTKKTMTPARARILDAIVELAGQHGYPPTLREVGTLLELTVNGVRDHVKCLQRDGYLSMEPLLSRSIRVLRMADGTSLVCPCCRQRIPGNEPGRGEVGAA